MMLRSEAVRQGCTGWVRNRRDGSVEAVVQAEEKIIEELVQWAKASPGMSEVERVEIVDTTGDFFEFSIRETV